MKTPNYDQLSPDHKRIIDNSVDEILANFDSEDKESKVIAEGLAEAFIYGTVVVKSKTPEQKLQDGIKSMRDFADNPEKMAALQQIIDEFMKHIDFNTFAPKERIYRRERITKKEREKNEAMELSYRQQEYERDLSRIVQLLIAAGKYSGLNQVVAEAKKLLEIIKQTSLEVVI